MGQANVKLHEITRRKEVVKSLHEIQGTNGNWNVNPYMCGLFNGLELAVATLEGRDPVFREVPEGTDKSVIRITKDGDQYCALIGEDLMSGIAGFGDSISAAVSDLATEIALKEIEPNEANK